MKISRSSIVVAVIAAALAAAEAGGSAAARPQRAAAPIEAHAPANLPLMFVENRGRADARVRFYAQGARYAFYLTPREIVLAFLNESTTEEHALAMRFVGVHANAAISGAGEQGTFNYLQGSDPSRWQTDVPSYSTIVYRDLWPHVDLHVKGDGGALKYEFHVAAGAAPSAIRLAYEGAHRFGLAARLDGC